VNGWIVDKSVASRFDKASVVGQVSTLDGPLFLCEIGLLEQLFSSRSSKDYDKVDATLRENFTILTAPPNVLEQALALQRTLAHHRGLWHRRPIPDLMIAVTAAHHDVGVVHADSDFDMIAQVFDLRTFRVTVTEP
jgi:predicted nucleic acid-binding protein